MVIPIYESPVNSFKWTPPKLKNRIWLVRVSGDFANEWFRQRHVANVFGRLANAMSRLANVLLVTSPMY